MSEQHSLLMCEPMVISDNEMDGIEFTSASLQRPSPSSIDKNELDDLKAATSGRKRGRKPGSGLGEKRKREGEYSTNPNTVKSRNRYQSLGKHAREVHAARTADLSAVSRSTKKLKQSAEYQAADEVMQKKMINKIKERVLNDRSLSPFTIVLAFALISRRTDQGYSASLLISAKEALLEQQKLRDEDFVEDALLLGLASDEDAWWTDTDEYVGTEVKAAERRMRFKGKIVQGEALEDIVTEEPDLMASLLDGVLADPVEMKEKRTLTEQEQIQALEVLSHRQRLQLVSKGKNIAFRFFKKEYFERIENLKREELFLESLGPAFVFKHFKMGEEMVYYDDRREAYVDVVDVNKKFLQLGVAGALPHKFFSKESRGLLRCAWAVHDDEWITLPGPAEIWPDKPDYYVKHGFEVRPKRKDRHLKALQLLAMEQPTEGWLENVVHDNDRYELVWNPAL